MPTPRCCHAQSMLLCPHPCPACRSERARRVVLDIKAFDRECQRDEHTDVDRAWELLTDARLLLTNISIGKR